MSSRSRYSLVAIAMHWLIAALILINLFLGWRMGQLDGLAKFETFQLHKSLGISVLVLSVFRLGWRLLNPPLPLPPGMAPRERVLASATHWAFYALMIVLPLTGWVIVSASPFNIPTMVFQTLPWPHLGFIHDLPLEIRKAIEGAVGGVHEVLAYGWAALIVLHVTAALKHQFVDRDNLFGRMIPGLSKEI